MNLIRRILSWFRDTPDDDEALAFRMAGIEGPCTY